MRRDLLVLFAFALVVRGVAAALISIPPYTDPAYYTVVAQQLALGHGFSTPVLWSFLETGGAMPVDPSLPLASNGHWMPLTSMVAWPFVALLGGWLGTWHAAQVPMVILGAGLVPFTYLVGWELWASRRVALGGSILVLLGGPFLVYAPMVDNFAVFGAAGAGALYAAVRAVRAERPGEYVVFETYRDRAAFEAHLGSAHSVAFNERLAPLVAGGGSRLTWLSPVPHV